MGAAALGALNVTSISKLQNIKQCDNLQLFVVTGLLASSTLFSDCCTSRRALFLGRSMTMVVVSSEKGKLKLPVE
jgi:hypothetical protein